MNSFATIELAQAWNDRKLELKMTRLQRYADTVAADLAVTFTAERDNITRALHECVARATKPYELVIPIRGFRYGMTLQAEDDPYPMSYYNLVTHTDLCEQVAVFFGALNFWVTWRKHTPDEYQLMLNYYPDGLPESKRDALEACASRHAERHAPVTPPRPVVFAAPPPLKRRKVDMSDSPRGPVTMAPPPPAHFPSSRDFPSSRAYAGGWGEGFIREYDSVEDAGRDFARDLMAELEQEDTHHDCATCREAAAGAYDSE